ncbi:MAG: 5-(carboxyamino)imidazole ribonucleotide mutase [Methanomicrobiales archaeon]
MVDVSIISGSASDDPVVDRVSAVLEEEGVSYDRQVLSAHRDPERLAAYVAGDPCRVYIAIAGLSAALPGVIASRTVRPVIGVPVAAGALNGLDALLSIAQMPKGVPVACVGIGNGENAAALAVRILRGSGP